MIAHRYLAPLVAVTLQGVQAFRFYTDRGCELNLEDPNSDYVDIPQLEPQGGQDEDLACWVQHWSDDDWPTEGQVERKVIWLDHAGIDETCKLLLYLPPDSTDPTDGHCVRQYISFGSNGPCSRATVPNPFGYSYCCGEECGLDPVGDLFSDSSRREASEPPPVDTLFLDSNVAQRSVPRNPADIKKRAPLERLGRRQDEECQWVNVENTNEPYDRQMGQYRIGPFSSCEATGGCDDRTITLSYSETVSESFGMEAGLGGSLFEAISLSMSFSYSRDTSQEESYSYAVPYSIPQGAVGYVAWNPIAECVRGEFTEGCDGWESGREGEACFLKMINGIPDGEFYEVIENP